MTKIQSILCLLLFLVILFSMDMIFGNYLRKTFSYDSKGVSSTRKNMNINQDYLMSVQSDDEPLFFNFFKVIQH